MTKPYELGFVWVETQTVDPTRLRGALHTLTSKQRFVVELRFGLRDGTAYTLDEIASLMGITNQAVSRLEQKGLVRLRLAVGVGKNVPTV